MLVFIDMFYIQYRYDEGKDMAVFCIKMTDGMGLEWIICVQLDIAFIQLKMNVSMLNLFIVGCSDVSHIVWQRVCR